MKVIKDLKMWFPVPDDEDGAQVEIKHLNSGDIQDISDETFKIKPQIDAKSKSAKDIQINAEYNQKLEREMTILRAITGLKNFFDKDGKEIARTDENVLMLSRVELENGFKFLEFITNCRGKLAEQAAKQKEVEEKN